VPLTDSTLSGRADGELLAELDDRVGPIDEVIVVVLALVDGCPGDPCPETVDEQPLSATARTQTASGRIGNSS
jgi:hypothetical protein